MLKLILTEKPSQAREFAKALKIPARGAGFYAGGEWLITWAIGHLLIPKDPHEYNSKWKRWKRESLPMVPQVFSHKPALKTKTQLTHVIKLLCRRDIHTVIVATDAGREGELIARTLIHHAQKQGAPEHRKYLRFWSSEALTPQVIHRGLKECQPLEEFDGLFLAARARQCADWLVGMNLTRLMSLLEGDLFSVGRVQTAVLGLIEKRDRERREFIAQKYFNLYAIFGEHEARYFNPDSKPESSIFDENEASLILKTCKGKPLEVKNIEQTKEVSASPMLYSLTQLQQAANQIYGMSAQKTLGIAQRLYEKYKCLSYPRTDSKVLGIQSFSLAQEILKKIAQERPEFGRALDDKKISPSFRKIFNNQKLTDHHALIPLKWVNFKQGSEEAKIMELITRRFFQAFSRDALIEKQKACFNAQATPYLFTLNHEKVIDDGWRMLDPRKRSEVQIPYFKVGDIVRVDEYCLRAKETIAPSLYNEASLLKEMTNPSRFLQDKKYEKVFSSEIGLGTQATRAQIIETLLERQYISRQKRELCLEEKGRHLIHLLQAKTHSRQMTDVDSTAFWEVKLEAIANRVDSPQEFLKGIHQLVVGIVKEWDETPSKPRQGKRYQKNPSKEWGLCPVCRVGKVKENQKAYYCTGWKQGCNLTIWKKIAGKKITPKNLEGLITEGETQVLKGFRSKERKSFSAKMKLNQGKVELVFENLLN